jgi:hypothetical protein
VWFWIQDLLAGTMRAAQRDIDVPNYIWGRDLNLDRFILKSFLDYK